jgi:DNA-binding PadR family transcriptional regulator
LTTKKKCLGEFEQMIIAAVLRLGDEAYGTSIIDSIARHTGREVGSGALSVTLDRLERKGLVRSELADPGQERAGRPRRYIRVTPAGLALARDSRLALLNVWRGIEGAYEK